MISIDQGRSAFKILCQDGRKAWPPLVARLEQRPPDGLVDAGPERGTVLRLAGTWWAVGEPARALPQAVLRMDERKASDAARVVVAAVLAATGAQGRAVVALAVPAGLVSADAHELARLVSGWISGTTLNGTPLATAVEPYVLVEPVAAALSTILDTNGQPDREALERTTAVADLGHRTLDIAVLRRGRLVEGTVRSTPSGGILAHERWVREAVEPSVGLLTDSERAAVVSAAASGCAPVLRGRQMSRSILERLHEHRAWLAQRVIADLRNTLAGVEHDALFMTGGLAEWLRAELRSEWPYAQIPSEPRWAVAEGGLRYLRYLSRRRAAEQPAQAVT